MCWYSVAESGITCVCKHTNHHQCHLTCNALHSSCAPASVMCVSASSSFSRHLLTDSNPATAAAPLSSMVVRLRSNSFKPLLPALRNALHTASTPVLPAQGEQRPDMWHSQIKPYRRRVDAAPLVLTKASHQGTRCSNGTAHLQVLYC